MDETTATYLHRCVHHRGVGSVSSRQFSCLSCQLRLSGPVCRCRSLHETEPGPEKISYSLESLAAVIAHRLDRTGLLAESRDSYVQPPAPGSGRVPAASTTSTSALVERIVRWPSGSPQSSLADR